MLFALLTLVGCSPYVAVLRGGAPAPVAAATVAPPAHALAIVGIDFDPPLDRRAAAGGGVSLIAAIQNQGLSDEQNVHVSAQLLDPAPLGGPAVLFDETVVVDTVPAGQVRFVRFPPLVELPPSLARYQLALQVQPVAGEADTADNKRTYDIVPRSDD